MDSLPLGAEREPSVTTETPERPISTRSQDVLGRDNFVERLCSMLIDDRTRKATGVVVAVTGEWGSGKSSVLNLVDERLAERYFDAIVVRFNPWLVSAGSDLVAEFLSELTASVGDQVSAGDGGRLTTLLAEYRAHLAPACGHRLPAPSEAAGHAAGMSCPGRAQPRSLHVHRQALVAAFQELARPTVVLIDELDRVEDREIRTMAQIVRSIADFPSISYLLAYDANRVIEALGGSAPDGNGSGRGRDYLEKIVQLHIQLPVSFSVEIEGLFMAELKRLNEVAPLADPEWEESPRFKALTDLLIRHSLMDTPRDVKRIVGIFQALYRAVKNEVEWEDILGISALQAKVPQIVDRIRQDPESFVVDPVGRPIWWGLAVVRDADDKLKTIFGDLEIRPGVRELLEFLFPALCDGTPQPRGVDSVSNRRPLLTLLRLGLLPGRYSREDIAEFFRNTRKSKYRAREFLKASIEQSRFGAFLDRFEELYGDGRGLNERNAWLALSAVVEKPRRALPSRYEVRASYPGMVSRLLARSATRSGRLRSQVHAILRLLIERNCVHVPADIIRHHMFAYGLFGNPYHPQELNLLSAEQTQDLAHLSALLHREMLLSGKLLSRLWEITAFHNMADLGVWDDECRIYLSTEMEREPVLHALVLWMFGGMLATDPESIARILDVEKFFQLVRETMGSRRFARFDPTLKAAYQKTAEW